MLNLAIQQTSFTCHIINQMMGYHITIVMLAVTVLSVFSSHLISSFPSPFASPAMTGAPAPAAAPGAEATAAASPAGERDEQASTSVRVRVSAIPFPSLCPSFSFGPGNSAITYCAKQLQVYGSNKGTEQVPVPARGSFTWT